MWLLQVGSRLISEDLGHENLAADHIGICMKIVQVVRFGAKGTLTSKLVGIRLCALTSSETVIFSSLLRRISEFVPILARHGGNWLLGRLDAIGDATFWTCLRSPYAFAPHESTEFRQFVWLLAAPVNLLGDLTGFGEL